jgi:hypothetical protein
MYGQDAAVMCNAAVLAIIGAVVLICLRSIASSLHQRDRRGGQAMKKRQVPDSHVSKGTEYHHGPDSPLKEIYALDPETLKNLAVGYRPSPEITDRKIPCVRQEPKESNLAWRFSRGKKHRLD